MPDHTDYKSEMQTRSRRSVTAVERVPACFLISDINKCW